MTRILRQTEMSQRVLFTWVLGSLLFSLFYVPVYDCKDLALVGDDVWFSYNLTESQVALYGHWGCGTSHHGQLVLISLVCEALLHLLDGLDPTESIKQAKWRQGVTLISPKPLKHMWLITKSWLQANLHIYITHLKHVFLSIRNGLYHEKLTLYTRIEKNKMWVFNNDGNNVWLSFGLHNLIGNLTFCWSVCCKSPAQEALQLQVYSGLCHLWSPSSDWCFASQETFKQPKRLDLY